jgi:hypothetical protein
MEEHKFLEIGVLNYCTYLHISHRPNNTKIIEKN